MEDPRRRTMLPSLLVLTLLAGLLLGPGTAQAEEGPSVHLKLTLDDVVEGNLKLSVNWASTSARTPTRYGSWETFTDNIMDDLRNASNLPQIHALGDTLASWKSPAVAATMILAPENRGFATVVVDRLAIYNDHLVVSLDYTFNETTKIKLHPLAFIDDIIVGDSSIGDHLSTSLSAITSKKVHLTTSRFLFNHIRTHEGERIGGSGQGMTYLENSRVSLFDTSADTLTIESADSPLTPLTPTLMAGLLILFLVLLIFFLKLMGKEALGGFLYFLAALVLFVLVSLPLSGYLFLAVLILGLLRLLSRIRVHRQRRLIKTEVKQDMLGSLDKAPEAQEKAGLAELEGSGNIMARLFPFKIKELFMIYNDGRLISHATFKVGGTVDSQIVSTMLTAIQDFISDSFKTGDEEALENIKYGKIHLFIQRGKHIYLAAVIDGTAPDTFSGELKELVNELEDDYRSLLIDWDGETTKLNPAQADMEKFIRYWSKD